MSPPLRLISAIKSYAVRLRPNSSSQLLAANTVPQTITMQQITDAMSGIVPSKMRPKTTDHAE